MLIIIDLAPICVSTHHDYPFNRSLTLAIPTNYILSMRIPQQNSRQLFSAPGKFSECQILTKMPFDWSQFKSRIPMIPTRPAATRLLKLIELAKAKHPDCAHGTVLSNNYGKVVLKLETSTGEEFFQKKRLIEWGSLEGVKYFFREVCAMVLLEDSGVTMPTFSITGDTRGDMVSLSFWMRKMETTVSKAAKDKKISVVERMKIAFGCALSLFLLHSFQIQHRDVKSDNFFIDHGQVFIADLESAIARSTVDECAHSNHFMTEDYAAPEVREHRNFSFPADIYSLGTVFYELVTGRSFRDPLVEIDQDGLMAELIASCLSDDPSERHSAYVIVQLFVAGFVWFPGMSEDERREVCEYCNEKYQKIMTFIREVRCRDVLPQFPATWQQAVSTLETCSVANEASIGAAALMLHWGLLLDRDDYQALMMLKRSNSEKTRMVAELIGQEDSDYARGCFALSNGEIKEAVGWFRAGIGKKCTLCLTQLGMLLIDLKKVEKGEALLRIAAKSGDVKAMFRLGVHLVRSNPKEALLWLEQANERGHHQCRTLFPAIMPMLQMARE